MTLSQELFDQLADMSVKGGSDMGVVAAQALQAYAEENLTEDLQAHAKLDQFVGKLKDLKPSMATVHNVADRIMQILMEHRTDAQAALRAIDDYVCNYQSSTDEALQELAGVFSAMVSDGDVILTHSYTKSVLLSLEKAATDGKSFAIHCTESRPLKEGVYLATQLAHRGIRATIITDAAAAHYLPTCTKVVVGADALYTDGTIVNKMGTLGVAMLAKEYKKPVYVLAGASKLYLPSLRGERLELERRPGTEIVPLLEDADMQHYLTVENVFFEAVPADYITYLVTEKGVLRPCQVLGLVRDMGDDAWTLPLRPVWESR